ncbi:hypothetical protein EOI86_08775 [Hwanghaeella grinnelliae]|uniref:PA14 domain-containing protein n=1 Tax=Hwanghaeella grinnelliae TaxID=2500179 RepID=A0A3S2W7R4_9PROT|nr:YqiA/YcfP family alpha/beta fold hydrolase [Hwanghaeella grinnelliae]RVU39317.1 hypothetical protein EOI86_08775 [Hwanghaeella grinnelliae]
MVRDGAFEAFTVYTDDGRDPSEFSSTVILLLHGYQSAMPNDDYDAVVDLFGDTHTVVGFNYDYVDIEADKTALDEVFEHYLKGRTVIVLGTSLGGFWADYVLMHYPVAGAILVNPALDPGPVLRATLGTHQGDRRQAPFTVTEENAAAYDAFGWPAGGPHGPRLVLLSQDDELLDPSEAVARFTGASDTTVIQFEQGGHNLALDRPDVVDSLRSFVARVAPGERVDSKTISLNRFEPFVPSQISEDDPSLRDGLRVDYYYGKLNKVDVLRGLIRTRKAIVGQPIQALNYVGNEDSVLTSPRADMVGARIQGLLEVQEPGVHYLRVTSNDGVELWIAGQLLYRDPKVHADRASPILGADFPEPGLYPVEILYFEKKGSSTLKLEWRQPGANDLSVIPADVFHHVPNP